MKMTRKQYIIYIMKNNQRRKEKLMRKAEKQYSEEERNERKENEKENVSRREKPEEEDPDSPFSSHSPLLLTHSSHPLPNDLYMQHVYEEMRRTMHPITAIL